MGIQAKTYSWLFLGIAQLCIMSLMTSIGVLAVLAQRGTNIGLAIIIWLALSAVVGVPMLLLGLVIRDRSTDTTKARTRTIRNHVVGTTRRQRRIRKYRTRPRDVEHGTGEFEMLPNQGIPGSDTTTQVEEKDPEPDIREGRVASQVRKIERATEREARATNPNIPRDVLSSICYARIKDTGSIRRFNDLMRGI
jgi:hypothetical protein